MSDEFLYFTNPDDGLVYAYDADQIAQGYGEGMVPLTGEALEAVLHPVPTKEEINAINLGEKNYRLDSAARVMAPILLSIQLGDATDDETLRAKAWQSYYRDLRAVDISVKDPEWPTPPETT